MKKIAILLLLFPFIWGCNSKENKYNIVDYGAKNHALSTKAIQKAIDECSESGGGTVYVPAGEYISGTLFLKSNVHLYLEHGSTIKGSSDLNDYTIDGKTYGLMYAMNAHNITISGRGTLDGNGTFFHEEGVPHIGLYPDYDVNFTRQKADFMNPKHGLEDGPIAYKNRPGMQMIFLFCENITLKEFTMVNSPSWSLRIGDCVDALVDGIRIFNNLLIPNSDGVHVTHSRNVRISNCDLRCGDDAIIVTGFPHGNEEVFEDPSNSTKDKQFGNFTNYSENVTVTNCVLQSRSAGIRVGYGHYPIRNCIFSNLVIYDSNRGLGVFAREPEANIENIYFDNIIISNRLHKGHWWGKGEPIHVSSIPRFKDAPAGYVRNIRFSNITAQSETGIVIWSDKENDIQDILFDNMKLTIKESPIADIYGGNFDLRPTNSMATSIFEHDIPAIFARNVEGLKLENIKVEWSGNFLPFYTYALECENVKDLVLNGFKGKAAQASLPAYSLKNSIIEK
ncbi:MAG: glycosyl hydrolase family 28 protein [Bacteroidales bacterium]|nr:glycosyl hydrolase family 28 protein [Bacteroidales bacterium]